MNLGLFRDFDLIPKTSHFQLSGQYTSDLLHKTHFLNQYFSQKDGRGHGSHFDRILSNLLNFNEFIEVFVGIGRKIRISKPQNAKN